MDLNRTKNVSQQAYIKNVMKARQARDGMTVSRLMHEGGGMAVDFCRQGAVVLGILGLMCIAVSVATGNKIFIDALNWVSSMW